MKVEHDYLAYRRARQENIARLTEIIRLFSDYFPDTDGDRDDIVVMSDFVRRIEDIASVMLEY